MTSDPPAAPSLDPLLDRAVRLIAANNRVSAEMLRRRLEIPLVNADALIAQMAELGFVGGWSGSNARLLVLDAAHHYAREASPALSSITPAASATVQELELAELTIEQSIQPRAQLNEETVESYRALLQDGEVLPPVVVYMVDDKPVLAAGFHRVEALRRAGRAKVCAEVRHGTRRDAQLHAIESNRRHGLPLSRADKQRAVKLLLEDEEWSRWSDRQIAQHCGVDHKTVGAARQCIRGNSPDSGARLAKRGDSVYRISPKSVAEPPVQDRTDNGDETTLDKPRRSSRRSEATSVDEQATAHPTDVPEPDPIGELVASLTQVKQALQKVSPNELRRDRRCQEIEAMVTSIASCTLQPTCGSDRRA